MFIPIGTLLWKFSKIVFKVENNEKSLNNLTEKLNSRVDKIDERFIENEAKLSNIEITMGRLEEKMNLLLTKITDNQPYHRAVDYPASQYGGKG
jgi:uncharacterized coiled-coil protein SlyX